MDQEIQNHSNDCVEREAHGDATEPRFTITLPPASAAEVFGSLLDVDEKNLDEMG
jgi:hypothetical protein